MILDTGIVHALADQDIQFTGRIRYREQKRWFRSSVLVLQLEEKLTRFYNEGLASQEITIWRDAEIQDILTDSVAPV